jgi:tripartite motif-containing protein 36
MHEIEYYLKYLLDSTTLRIDKLDDVTNPAQAAAFRKKYSDVRRVKAFCSEVGQVTYFPISDVPLSKDSTRHTAKFCEVAVGRSIYVSEELARQINPRDHYDSFIVGSGEYSSGLLDGSEMDIREYSYVVKDASKILPLFEVTFEYDPEIERRFKGNFICEKCMVSQSISFCTAERANFCEKCDKEIHHDMLLRRHERYYFNEVGKKRFIHCLNHSDTVVDYFCEECLVPVCNKCKISGSHSELPYASHSLLRYIEACDQLQSKLEENELPLLELEDGLASKIEDFGRKVGVFQRSVCDVRARIENEYRNVMNELAEFEKKESQKINTFLLSYLAEKHELARVREYPAGLEPSQLLRAFRNVINQREAVLSEDREADAFRPMEIGLKGHLTLKDEESYPARKGYSPRMEKSTQLYVETRGISVNQNECIKRAN